MVLAGALLIVAVGLGWLLRPPSELRKLPPREAVRIENVHVLDPESGIARLSVVTVREGKIVSVETASAAAPAPKDLRVLDGEGGYLSPGLFDAHVHVFDEAELAAYLVAGITTVRNMSGMPFHVERAKEIEAGTLLGPTLYTSGPILNSPGPNAQVNHALVLTAEEARTEVHAQHAAGYDFLKVYSNLYAPAYSAVLEEARALGMPIAGHSPEGERKAGIPEEAPFEIPLEAVLDDGFQTLEHVETLVWHGLRDVPSPEGLAELAKKIGAAKVAVTPTLVAHENLVRMARSRGALAERPGIETLNPVMWMVDEGSRVFWASQDPDAREAARVDVHLELTRRLHEAGVPLVAGSDAGIFVNIPGASLRRELMLLGRAGLSADESLEAATSVAAEVLGFEDRGRIAPGLRADLVWLRADPRADLEVFAHPEAVWVDGRRLDRTRLDELEALARAPSFLRTLVRALPTLLAGG